MSFEDDRMDSETHRTTSMAAEKFPSSSKVTSLLTL